MKVTLQAENQPEYRATVQNLPGTALDEVTLEPLTPRRQRCVFQVDTRVFAQMGMKATLAILPKNYPRGFFNVTRISWELFLFEAHSVQETVIPLLLEKVIVQFDFPKPRSFYRAVESELRAVKLGQPFHCVQVLLATPAEWDKVQDIFKAQSDFNEPPASYPCTAVIYLQRQNSGEAACATFVYPHPMVELKAKDVAEVFSAFRIHVAELLGMPQPEAALQEDILAKAAFMVGQCKSMREILPWAPREVNNLSEAFQVFRNQIAQILQIPAPAQALPEEIYRRIELLVRYLAQQNAPALSR